MNNFVDPEDDGDLNLPQLTSLTNSAAPPHRTNHPTVATTTTSQQQQLPDMAPFTHLSSSNHYHHAFTNSQDRKSSGGAGGVSPPPPQFREKGRRRSSSGIATTAGGGDCETSLATNEDTSFSFGVTTANDVTALSSVVGDNENSPLTLTAVSSSVVDHRRHSDLLSSNASLRDANPQTPNFVVAVVSSPPQPAGRIPGGGPPLGRPVQLPPSGAPLSSTASAPVLLNPIARLSSKQPQQCDEEEVQTELVGAAAPINRETTIGPSDDELVHSNQVQSMSSRAQGSSLNHHNNNNNKMDDDDEDVTSYDDVDICFPSMGGDDAAADETMMFLPTVGSSDDRLRCESTSNEAPPLPRPPTGTTTTAAAAPTTYSSSMKIYIAKSPQRNHSEDDFSPIPPQGDNDNDNEQQIVVAVGSHPSSTKRSTGGGFFQEVPPRRSTSSTSQQHQSSSPQQQSLWRNLTDHLEPSLRHLSSSSLNDSLGLPTASYSQHGSPLAGASRAAAAASGTGGSRPYLTLHHLHTHGLLDGSAIPSRSSSMSAESFEDPPLAMSPRYYGSDDDDDGNSSRGGSSVAYGLCGGSSHSSLFEHTPLEVQSIGTASTPPLSPPVTTSSVSPRTTRLVRGGPGFGSLGTPGARYGHIPHASTMFPSDSPLDLDKRN